MKKYIKMFLSAIGYFFKMFTMKDFLFFCGLIQLFVGLYLYNPWIAPTVTGSIMIVTGLFGKAGK